MAETRTLARRTVGTVVPVVLAVLAGLVVVWFVFGSVRGHRWTGTAFASPAPAPAFDGLVLDTGEPVDLADYGGRAVLLYFGYTNCPDVCPTTLWTAAKAIDALGPRGDDVQVLMVSVDPARDPLDTLGNYVRHFDERFRGVGGPEDAVAHVAGLYGVFFQAQEPQDDGFYEVDHTASLLGIDPEGRLKVIWSPDITPDQLRVDLEELLS